jgi:hypothetical protein
MSDTFETPVTITSSFAHLSASDPRRRDSDTKLLEAHWASEARLGHPLTSGQKESQRRLLALSGVVSTTGHERTKAAALRPVVQDVTPPAQTQAKKLAAREVKAA